MLFVTILKIVYVFCNIFFLWFFYITPHLNYFTRFSTKLNVNEKKTKKTINTIRYLATRVTILLFLVSEFFAYSENFFLWRKKDEEMGILSFFFVCLLIPLIFFSSPNSPYTSPHSSSVCSPLPTWLWKLLRGTNGSR